MGLAATFAFAWTQPLMAAARVAGKEVKREREKGAESRESVGARPAAGQVGKAMAGQQLAKTAGIAAGFSAKANANLIQKFAAGSAKQAEAVTELANSEARLVELKENLAKTTNATKKVELELEIKSLEEARATIAEFMDALGTFGKIESMKGADAKANQGLEKLVEIMPLMISKFRVVKDGGKLVHERDGYVNMMKAAIDLITLKGQKPADAIRQALGNDKLLEDLIKCRNA